MGLFSSKKPKKDLFSVGYHCLSLLDLPNGKKLDKFIEEDCNQHNIEIIHFNTVAGTTSDIIYRVHEPSTGNRYIDEATR